MRGPYILLMLLEQVEGDSEFVIDLLLNFCIIAKEQLVLCSRAAQVCDIATLSFEAHSMKGGAASCCATQVANLCGALEHVARLEQNSLPAKMYAGSASSFSPEYWGNMVGDISECFDTLSHYVSALASMRTLPSFNALKDACGETNDDIIDAVSHLLEAGVNAYVAAHAVSFKDVQCDIGEGPCSVAREKLGLVCAAAKTLSVEYLVRTAGLLSDHLATPPPSGDTALISVYRTESEHRLDEVRVTIECLAADVLLVFGEKMPVLAVPFADDAHESVGEGQKFESTFTPSTSITMSTDRGCEPICDYAALLQNTKDDHKFIAALLSNFKDSLSVFCDSLANQKCSLFDAHSLHGAAVSMCAPRVVAVIHDLLVASKAAQGNTNEADIVDLSVQRIDADAVERTICDLRAAVLELASFLQVIENAESPLHATTRRVLE
jgi:HPt (histidine-containing phosphotransfer) domain-containing protein